MAVTASLQARITKDWVTAFPSLVQFRPMKLLRRVGPIVMGITLDRESSGTQYRPTFHIHNLANAFPVMTLTLCHRLCYSGTSVEEFLYFVEHEEKWRDAAVRLRKQAPLPLEGNVKLEILLEAYHKGVEGKIWLREYEDFISIASWADRGDISQFYLAAAVATIPTWPGYVLERMAKFENFDLSRWSAEQLKVAENPELPREQVRQSIEQFKLAKLPVSELF